MSRKTRSPLISWDDRLYLSSAYPESDDDEVAPVFIIAVELSERQINDSLDQIAGMEGSGAALLADDGSWIVDGGAKPGLDGRWPRNCPPSLTIPQDADKRK